MYGRMICLKLDKMNFLDNDGGSPRAENEMKLPDIMKKIGTPNTPRPCIIARIVLTANGSGGKPNCRGVLIPELIAWLRTISMIATPLNAPNCRSI
jgi:hypothetical protein